MTSRTFSLSLAGAVIPAAGGAVAPPPATGPERHAFLFVGQSNTVGQAPDATADTFPAAALEFGPNGVWEAPGTRLHHPRSPRKGRPDPAADHGYARSFAAAYAAAHPGVEIYLIGAAQGGSGFHQGDWNRGDPAYGAAVARADAAMAAAPPGTVLKGILWHQGESDTIDKGAVAAWPSRMVQLIANLRADIAAAGPLTPFVVGGHERTSGLYDEAIDLAAQAMPNLADRVGFASPSSPRIATMADNVHFDSATQTQFGRRFAEALAPAAANARARTGTPAVGPAIQAPDLVQGTDAVGAAGLQIGPEAPDRTMLVGLVWRRAPTPSVASVTLGGVPLRRIGISSHGGSLCCTAWFGASMPKGTVADLAVGGLGAFDANQTKAVVMAVRGVAPFLAGPRGEGRDARGGQAGVSALSATVQVSAGDLVLGLAGTLGDAARTGTWSAAGASFGRGDFPMRNKMAAHLGYAVAPASASALAVGFAPSAPANQPGMNVIVLPPSG